MWTQELALADAADLVPSIGRFQERAQETRYCFLSLLQTGFAKRTSVMHSVFRVRDSAARTALM